MSFISLYYYFPCLYVAIFAKCINRKKHLYNKRRNAKSNRIIVDKRPAQTDTGTDQIFKRKHHRQHQRSVYILRRDDFFVKWAD